MKSRENDIIYLFYNYPTKHWHYSKLKETLKISDPKLSKWLSKLKKDNLIQKIKEKNKMPYYIGNYSTPNYRNSKNIFALRYFHENDFLNYLGSLNAKLVIIFGSFSRGDWYFESDIDLFVYGNIDEDKIYDFSKKLNREIQLFHCENRKSFRKMSNDLIKNILLGYVVKGSLSFVEAKFDVKESRRN